MLYLVLSLTLCGLYVYRFSRSRKNEVGVRMKGLGQIRVIRCAYVKAIYEKWKCMLVIINRGRLLNGVYVRMFFELTGF